MYIVTIYKDYSCSVNHFSKHFNDEDEAYDFFEEEVKDEFREEIENGLMSDQEVQNIINNESYSYELNNKEIHIKITEVDE